MASALKDTAERLTSSVAETGNRLRLLEMEASEDQGLAKEVTFLHPVIHFILRVQ